MVKIIALDLDGTLLTSKKELSEANFEVMLKAAERGIEIIPATGRFYKGIPEIIRKLPFIHYAITINGASVVNVTTGEELYSAQIDTKDALELLEYLDTFYVIYDCYYDGWGYMTESMQDQAADFIASKHLLAMVRELRSPVNDLKFWLSERNRCPQKIQAFTKNDEAYRDEIINHISERFAGFSVTSSYSNNIEINSPDADKGLALKGLAKALCIDLKDTAAFGDGMNDLSMIKMAGIGIAMENGRREVKEAADIITTDCDSDGVAAGILQLMRT